MIHESFAIASRFDALSQYTSREKGELTLMAVRPSRLGPYEVLSPLGSGGMGEVYMARDARLGRDVAIKVLPAELSAEPERLQRFEREARSASALNHPNIVVIYDVGHAEGVDFLVMELLDGESLLERLTRGPLPFALALRACREICSALEACHAKGIVHRDLKPGNIMLTRHGVKLVDFGLARAIEDDRETGELSSSADTALCPLTGEGKVVGTVPYMSPEQLQGLPVDGRCDIFALGALLHEAISGRRAFVGETNAAVAQAVLSFDPPLLSSLVPDAPRGLDRVIAICLAKDPELRWKSTHDVGLQLAAFEDGVEVVEGSSQSPTRAAHPRSVHARYVAGVMLALLLGALSATWWHEAASPPPAGLAVRFPLAPPAGGEFTYWIEGSLLAVSPDGSRVAFIATDASFPARIWLRALDELEPKALLGTEGANSLFWSPDGRSIGFFTNEQLKRVDLPDGAPLTLLDLPSGIGRAGSWGAGEILFASVQGEAMYRVSPDGGRAEVVLEPDLANGERRVMWPWFLPDGRTFLYVTKIDDGETHVMMLRPGAGETPREIGALPSAVQYVEPGVLVFVREGVLLAQGFDWHEGRLMGAPFPLASSVRYNLTTSWAGFATSPTGTLVYRFERDVMRFTWFDRRGRSLGNVGSPGEYQHVSLSPDTQRLLFDRIRPGVGTYDIWSLDVDRGVETRLTSSVGTESFPIWFLDGRSVIYSEAHGAAPQMVRRDLATGLTAHLYPGDGFQQASDISGDGSTLLFSWRAPPTGFRLWSLPLATGGVPSPLMTSAGSQIGARYSPDGRAIAYLADDAGRYEAYAVARDGLTERMQISKEGASALQWGRGGRELFYLTPDGRMFSVPVTTTGPHLLLGEATLLFETAREAAWQDFDVTPDGERFIAIVREASGDARPAAVVVNWPSSVQ